jgi:hypothetical protein
MGRLRTMGCIFVSVRCKDSPERDVWSPTGERRDAAAILVANEAVRVLAERFGGGPCACGARR